jgi:hypothetical protein
MEKAGFSQCKNMRLFEAIIDANHRAVAKNTRRAACLRKAGWEQSVRPPLEKIHYR